MKWLPQNLFKHQFIRPKKVFRRCNAYCNKELLTSKFYIVEKISHNKEYNQILSWCNKCYDENDEYTITFPSYIFDYNMLLLTHSDCNNLELIKSLDDKKREHLINYYKKLKDSITKDPYFRHLKRVANRHKLYNKNKNLNC